MQSRDWKSKRWSVSVRGLGLWQAVFPQTDTIFHNQSRQNELGSQWLSWKYLVAFPLHVLCMFTCFQFLYIHLAFWVPVGLSIFTARRYALRGLSHRNSVRPWRSVRPSVRLYVCLSDTLVDCVHMVQPTIMISSPPGSPMILISGDIRFIPKFEGGHPKRGLWMRVGWVWTGDFRPLSRRIAETVQDTTKVSIDH